jgi:hypothetical protein
MVFDLIMDQPRAVIKNGDGKIREREKVKAERNAGIRQGRHTDFSPVWWPRSFVDGK